MLLTMEFPLMNCMKLGWMVTFGYLSYRFTQNEQLLDQLSERHFGHRIRAIYIPAPTSADDMAILCNSPTDTKLALDFVSNYAKDHRYKI